MERTYQLSLEPGKETTVVQPSLIAPHALYPLLVSLNLSSCLHRRRFTKNPHIWLARRAAEMEKKNRPGFSKIRRLDVSCQISEKVVAFRPARDTASRNTLQSCKGRWDLRDIPQRRLPALRNSSSYIGGFLVADQCDVSPQGMYPCQLVPPCSRYDRAKKLDRESFLTRSTKII